MSVNKVILIGNLGRDPETRYTQGGAAITNFSIATTEKWKDKSGQDQEETTWHRIVTFGKLAEICDKYLAKGKQTYIEGRIKNGSYEKDGQTHYTTDIIASTVQFLGGADRQENRKPAQKTGGGYNPDDLEDRLNQPTADDIDIPF